MPSRRQRRLPGFLAIALALVVLVPLGGAAGVLLTLDPDSLKPWITEAVRRATGREMVIGGKLSISGWSAPTLFANDVTLANADGGSRPDMLQLERMEARLALLPLLRRRFEIVSLDLVRPDLLLETDHDRLFNWLLSPVKSVVPATAPSLRGDSAPASPDGSARQMVTVRAVRIQDGQITWKDARLGRSFTVAHADFDLTAASLDAPIMLDGRATVGNKSVAVSGQTGSLARLLNDAAEAAWPVQLSLQTPGARLGMSGSVAHPLRAQGYSFLLDGSAADLAEIGTVGGVDLPPLRAVTAAARIADDEGAAQAVLSISLHAGQSDLKTWAPGLQIGRIDIVAPRLDLPLHAELDGSLDGTPVRADATFGPPKSLLPGARVQAPFAVDVTAQAGGARFVAQGRIASPATLSGLDLTVSARIPDLAALSPLAGRPLPPFKAVAFDGGLADGEAGYAHGIVLRSLLLASPQGDVEGDATLGFGARPSIRGTLASKRLDIDALLSVAAAAAMPPQSPPPAATAPPQPAVTPPPAPAPARRLIPDTPLGFDRLDRGDADLQLNIGEMRAGGVVYRDVAGHLLLRDGKLTLNPFSGAVPGGALDVNLAVDARAPEPTVALALHAPALSVKSVLEAVGQPSDAAGTAEIDADLRASGRTPRTLASTVDGRAGIAMLDGDIDNRLLASLAVEVMHVAKLPTDLGSAGRTRLRCAAIRVDATHGVVTIGALVLDSGRVLITGGGEVNLVDESLALRLRPMLRSGPGLVVPVRVTGTLRDPKFAVDAGGALEGLAAKTGILGALGASRAAERGADACGPAISAVRGGPLPAAAPAAKPPKPIDVLRGLLAPNG